MLVGVYFYRKCTKFQLNYVLNAMVMWPAMWKVFKKPFVFAQQPFNVFGMIGNFSSSFLISNMALGILFNISMSQNISHTIGRNYLSWVSVHTLQNHRLPFSVLESYLGYLVIHGMFSNGVKPLNSQHHVGVFHIDDIKIFLPYVVSKTHLQIWNPPIAFHSVVSQVNHNESFKRISW